jgi:hypothetical protein
MNLLENYSPESLAARGLTWENERPKWKCCPAAESA